MKNEKTIKYSQALHLARKAFAELIIQHISLTKNGKAVQLPKMTSSLAQPLSLYIVGDKLISHIEHVK